MEKLLLIAYVIPLLFVFGYSLVQLSLVINYLQSRSKKPIEPPPFDLSNAPLVTFQLPIYNELYVVERLIEAIAVITYPKNRFEIQVLDDSTDETVELIANKIQQVQKQGISIYHIRRPNRNGFKAGALAEGLKTAKGEFVAIFDADFVPEPDFLLKTLPHFVSPMVGVVQTRWEHLNENFSILTKLQAFGLDAHFSIEQKGRNVGGHFINFNGTAGIWRKRCVENAGGWQADTLTEDLDLSYRAQMNGWQFVYLEHVGSPAELPVEMNALKSQQFRWTKGAAECARKHLFNVLKNKHLSLKTKIYALFHLMNSTAYICVLWVSILSVPILYIKNTFPQYHLFFLLAGIFQISLIILGTFYWVSYRKRHRTIGFFWYFPMFLSFMMGLSLHNAIAVLEGYSGKKTPFIRTPKFNVQLASDRWQTNRYISRQITPLIIIEGFFVLYFFGALLMALRLHDFWLFPFHLLLMVGFAAIFIYSMIHSRVQTA